MKKKNLIVFDIDGTLTDSVGIHQKAFIEALSDLGIEKIDSNFKEYKHHTDSYIAKVIYENDKKELISELKASEFEHHLTKKVIAERIDEIRGATNLIENLENQTDFGVCFATGSLRRPAEFKLKSIGIDFSDKQLVASDDIFERENIVQKAIDNASDFYNVKNFDRIISVGDGLWDLITAKNLGLEFIGVGLTNQKVMAENGTEIHYENLTEFKIKEKTLYNIT
ncbi:MAG: HAD family hydrolase [Flavobacteriales bacterium]|nr:HAD family hydrolase [Flavobacteriales bacterium]